MNNRQARKTGRTILVCGFVFVVLNQFLLGALMIGVGLLFSLLLGRCPHCGKTMAIRRGIEVGHVFKLGTKYADAFNAVFKTDDLQEKTMVMGCYGIGISRTLQAVIEQSHDKDGIIWPSAVAPYQVVIDLLDPADESVANVAAELEAQLEEKGVDVIVDDREERPGVKFKDADLIGFTVRVVVGAKGLAKGGVEIKARKDPKEAMKIVPPAEAPAAILELLASC